jgi:hypothetical protein
MFAPIAEAGHPNATERLMTFRVEDLTVSLLPERYDAANPANCTKCTKCTARTGGPSECSCPSDQGGCECANCKDSSSPAKKSQAARAADDLAILRAQLDEFLATVGK